MQKLTRIPNAQKWTEERVLNHLYSIKSDFQENEMSYLGEALTRQGLYLQIWSYWKKAFAANDRILEQMLIIESCFEVQLVRNGLLKNVPQRLVSLILKNNHGWKENPKDEDVIDESIEIHQPEPEEKFPDEHGITLVEELPGEKVKIFYRDGHEHICGLYKQENSQEGNNDDKEEEISDIGMEPFAGEPGLMRA